ncbi:unnamed protein product [Allacma fusca]|uniref:Uncharacterized protein n=1 Tax=Allacma fusca TaxID=39272 RepID=A0A8J2JYF8_9HEXA|nr:unnamed protein product [Allacma fusca]
MRRNKRKNETPPRFRKNKRRNIQPTQTEAVDERSGRIPENPGYNFHKILEVLSAGTNFNNPVRNSPVEVTDLRQFLNERRLQRECNNFRENASDTSVINHNWQNNFNDFNTNLNDNHRRYNNHKGNVILERFRKECNNVHLENDEQENQNVDVNETSGFENVVDIYAQRNRDIEAHDRVLEQWRDEMMGMPHRTDRPVERTPSMEYNENVQDTENSQMEIINESGDNLNLSECPTVSGPSETRNINSTRRVRNTTSGRGNLRRSERLERRQWIFENQPMKNTGVPSLESMSEFPELERNS